ncbi:MAG: hypothetical protein RL672_792 [Actinomycetota bacterium]
MSKLSNFVSQLFRFIYLNVIIYGMTKHKH